MIEVTSNVREINFEPTTKEEIIQNVSNLLRTLKSTVPLNRGQGLTGTAIDKTSEVAKAILTSEIIDLINDYEPRVKVIDIVYDEGIDGVLIPRVRLDINV